MIFPEGRITVTGSLMKVYDGTAMIADKADAVVVPVRIEGAAALASSAISTAAQIKRVWFPKVTVTILPPVKLAVDPALRGKARRNAAGAALQDVMIDAAGQDRACSTRPCSRRSAMPIATATPASRSSRMRSAPS